MSIILCIETSTTNCSVAVSKGDELLSLVEQDSKNYSHAEQLHIFIERALQQAKVSKKDLSAIAISKGPGSYTGLRIGVSAAKGLSYALNIPLISISTLLTLGRQISAEDSQAIIIPMIDARRMEVYTQVFDSQLNELTKIEAKVLDEASYSNYIELSHAVFFIGNGSSKFESIIDKNTSYHFINKNPSAREMISIAYQKYRQHRFEDVAYFEPFYLKDFVVGK